MPRHKTFTDAILAYRNRPEGEPVPVKTNWTVVPANDNANPEDLADKRIERRWAMRPTLQEIFEQVENGEVVRNDNGQVVAIGTLRFSDGAQTERAYCYGPDGKLIRYDAPMPIGSMLNTRDKQERVLGGEDAASDASRSNSYFKSFFTAKAPNRVKREERTTDEGYGREDAVTMLNAAIANTPEMPAVTKCATGWPWQPRNLRDMFVGMQKGKNGESGSLSWEDISTAKVDREVWAETVATLGKQDKDTLDAAMTASTLADISPGGHPKGATRRGKRMLQVANDNLIAALKKVAA